MVPYTVLILNGYKIIFINRLFSGCIYLIFNPSISFILSSIQTFAVGRFFSYAERAYIKTVLYA